MNIRSLEPVQLGMAGQIYLSPAPRCNACDDSWVRDSFLKTPRIRRTEWRSENVFVITQEQTEEAGAEATDSFCKVPAVGGFQGISYGQFFGLGKVDRPIHLVSKEMLSAFQQAGPHSFKDVNGAWVGVIWDGVRQKACFVRDGLGIQTIYVALMPDRVLFSTDLRVLQFSGMFDDLDEQAMAEFLHYLYVPAPLTILKKIHAVLPGHVLWLDEKIRQERYSPPRFVRGAGTVESYPTERSTERYLPEFEKLLLHAVEDCVPRRGRIALALSGGKDSSTLAVALSKVCPDRVLAFNVGSTDERFNETKDAALVGKALGFAFQSYIPTDRDLARGLRHFASVQDNPVGDPAALPYFLAMKNLPDDCSVILDGTGNDYYFGIPSYGKGVHRYRLRLQIERNMPLNVWKLILRLMSWGPGWMRELREYWSKPSEESFVAWDGWTAEELSTLFRRQVSFADTYLWELMQKGESEDWVTLLTNVVCGVWEPHTAYRKAMLAHALGKGIRFPFTDNRLAQFINRLPVALKFEGGKNKVLLRAYMAKHLPQEILIKPKAPFVFDLNRLMQNSEYRWVEDLNQQGILQILPNLDNESIQQLLSRHAKDPKGSKWKFRLYALCLLSTFLAVRRGWNPDYSA